MTPIGLIFAGPLADRVGVQSWYLVGGVVCALMGVWGFSNRNLMEIEETDATHSFDSQAKDKT